MNTVYDWPEGFIHSLDRCGVRPPTGMPWPPTDNLDRPSTSADLEAMGMRVGIEGAKEIIRHGMNGKRSPHRVQAIEVFKESSIRAFVREAGDHLTEDLEKAFRKGVDRGLTSQLKHPTARIDIKIVKAPAVV